MKMMRKVWLRNPRERDVNFKISEGGVMGKTIYQLSRSHLNNQYEVFWTLSKYPHQLPY
jgi:hypothetical protein